MKRMWRVVLFFLCVSLLCQGCIVSEHVKAPPIKMPALPIQRVLGTVEYV